MAAGSAGVLDRDLRQTLILATLVTVAAHAVSYTLFRAGRTDASLPAQWAWQFVVLQAAGLATACAVIWLRDSTVRFLLFTVRIAIIILLGVPMNQRALVQVPLLVSLAFDAGAILPAFLAPVAAACTALAVTASWQPVMAWNVVVGAATLEQLIVVWFSVTVACTFGVALRSQVRSKTANIEMLRLQAQSASELARVNLSLQQYSSEVEHQAMLDERKRLTRELHDTVGYALMNQITLMEVATRLSGTLRLETLDGARRDRSVELMDVLHQSRRQAQDGLKEVRNTLHLLRESQPAVRRKGIARIRRLVDAFKSTQIVVRLELSNVSASGFGDEIDYILYRAVQEGITNALRHGNATEIRILLWQDEEKISVTISDNGKGAQQITEGIGLFGIAERIERIGGEVSARNSPHGFDLRVRIPWKNHM